MKIGIIGLFLLLASVASAQYNDSVFNAQRDAATNSIQWEGKSKEWLYTQDSILRVRWDTKHSCEWLYQNQIVRRAHIDSIFAEDSLEAVKYTKEIDKYINSVPAGWSVIRYLDEARKNDQITD